ncbi:MAG TPA: YhfC family glutamic-type intramembrane protease [Anaerolineales bacterium]|nr:YhfC family glutamic-type intramembrane protease [Anaerolineales bacterium]
MDILFWTHLLNGLLMVGMPIGLGIFLTRKFHLDWRLWWIGAATFVLSQLGHIPFNLLVSPLFNQYFFIALPVVWQRVINAVFLGLSAGFFEEFFRYGMYRWWAKDARSWRKGLLAGAGHGGAEAIILGGITLYAFIQLATLRNADLSHLVPASQLAAAQQQVHSYWTMPWAASLLGALERFFTIPIQVSFAVLVLQTFTRKQWYWVWLAVLYHALIDATAVIVPAYIPGAWVEAFVAFYALVSVVLIFTLRQPEPPEAALPVSDPVSVMPLKPVEETRENLDNTRFS